MLFIFRLEVLLSRHQNIWFVIKIPGASQFTDLLSPEGEEDAERLFSESLHKL